MKKDHARLEDEFQKLQEEWKHSKEVSRRMQERTQQLETTMETQHETLFRLEQLMEVWEREMTSMKRDTIQSRVQQELLLQENALLKQQEGEDQDVLMLDPNAKNTLVKSVVDRLGQTWDKALEEANKVKGEVMHRATLQFNDQGRGEPAEPV